MTGFRDLQAKDIMVKKPLTFHPDRRLLDAVRVLIDQRIPGAPVVDDQGNLLGVLTERAFLETVVFEKERELVHHVAKKKIPHVGAGVKPAAPNGIKMEKFVFDVFRFAERFVVWECEREEEFAPLKNAEGAKDSTPTYCRNALLARSQKWALAAGATFVDGDGKKLPQMASPAAAKEANNNEDNNNGKKDVVVTVEISPLVSYAGEGLEASMAGQTIVTPVHVQ